MIFSGRRIAKGKAMNKRVAVLMGGPSEEHDVSLRSGQQVLETLEQGTKVVISKTGQWVINDEPFSTIGAALDALARSVDAVFIALHGPFGEDGTVQGLLESFGLPYTGSGIKASALAMDKARAKLVYCAKGLPTPDFEMLAPGQPVDDAQLEAIAERFGLPCAVKLSCNGSSFGVSFPRDFSALRKDVRGHLASGGEVVIERFVKGREFTGGVLQGPRTDSSDGLIALPITEIIPDARYEFFDYEAKYTPGATQEITPAEVPDALAKRMQALAVDAHRALGCRGFSRTDFMLNGEQPMLLETNTIPGLTRESLLPKAVQAAGMGFGEMVALLIDDALRGAA